MTWTILPTGTSTSSGLKKHELVVAVALHAAADHLAVEHVERSEQCRGAVALVVMGHRSAAARLERQPRLGAVERLDLAPLVEREDDRVSRQVE
jgi:hypothetical protein